MKTKYELILKYKNLKSLSDYYKEEFAKCQIEINFEAVNVDASNLAEALLPDFVGGTYNSHYNCDYLIDRIDSYEQQIKELLLREDFYKEDLEAIQQEYQEYQDTTIQASSSGCVCM